MNSLCGIKLNYLLYGSEGKPKIVVVIVTILFYCASSLLYITSQNERYMIVNDHSLLSSGGVA